MARGERIRRLEGSHRYGLVLVMTILPIAFSLAAPPDEPWARALTVVLFAAAIIVTLAVAHAKRGLQLSALARGVIRHLRAERTVTLDAVYGAIAIYLLIGAFFATIDAAVGQLGSDPFFTQLKDPGFEQYMYFSYVTLATVGYGDFTPATSLARALSVTEALSGQLYLVTIVAVLVSNVGRRRTGDSG